MLALAFTVILVSESRKSHDEAGTRQHTQHGYEVVQNRIDRYTQQRPITYKHTNNNNIITILK
jgi:hypothetical protein